MRQSDRSRSSTLVASTMYQPRRTHIKLSMHITGCSKQLTTHREFTSEQHSDTTTWDGTRKPPSSGKLLHKIVMEYQEDENGNWIEQREPDWDDTLEDKPPKLVVVSRRTIAYY